MYYPCFRMAAEGGSLFSKIRGQQIPKIKNSYVLPDIFSFLVVLLKKKTILFVSFQKYTHICTVIHPVTYEVTDKKSDY
ncbi:hypothetical protein JCM6292_3788 [Bacteroides pyogenes JCM 6292]|uniref:Uncharacterized protein n=1 Tax=Bacteroides pyogenes JCM 6292 TaxID=1235809 RepID=W4PBN9_9BACE|nr:hypothetical protein JCM6292_3788 [Bacteroides pyogenes JCM 6292]